MFGIVTVVYLNTRHSILCLDSEYFAFKKKNLGNESKTDGGCFSHLWLLVTLKTMQTNFFKYPRELAIRWILLTYALQKVASPVTV